MHFPLSAPMPAMPHQWVALMPCALKSAVDHAALQSDASAIIVYPTMRANCSRTPALKDSPVPLMILDYESSKQLILTLDNLSHGTRAMATLSTATLGIDSTRTKSVGTDMEVDNEEKAQDAHEISQEGFGDSLHTEGHGQPEQRQVVLSLPETASMVDSFKSRAVLQARRILVSLGLGTRYTEFNESLSARPDSFGKENSGLAQPVHPAQTSQILDEIQSLVLLEDSRHANSLSTQLATVFMSTICGVGIGMFGALLFVVVLKLRLAQMSRRSGRSGGQGRLTAAQQLQVAHQQIMRDTCCRRLLPKTVLEGYAVHTVLHTSPSMVKLSAPATTEKPRSGMAWLFSKPEQNCMEDVVGTEGFQGGLEAKETARRQRLRLRRRSRTANECDYESEDEEEEEDVEGDDEDEVNDDEDVTSENEADEEAHTDSAVDMDQATAAITTATSQDSYHRVTYNRQGHLNPPSPSSSSSSSSESFSSKGRCSTQKKKKQGELPFANANAQTMCAVCLTDYEVGDKVRILPCFHQYHQECIDPWLLDVVSLCPICKVDLRHTSSSPK
ncbi:hypothetical protein EDD21DRAFT_382644 [Dissophora ornata]|nr:hypothetical protein EDD21DRAFT_382644 [Dissophora ornata]